MATRSYIYRILARLAHQQATLAAPYDAQSTEDLLFWLENTRRREGIEMFMPNAAQLKTALRLLEGLGVVQGTIRPEFDPDGDKDNEKKKERCEWRFAGSVPPNWETLRRDGGTGDDPPQPPTPGGGDGAGGGGLAQIIAHPVLFSLSENSLDAALSHAFGVIPRDD